MSRNSPIRHPENEELSPESEEGMARAGEGADRRLAWFFGVLAVIFLFPHLPWLWAAPPCGRLGVWTPPVRHISFWLMIWIATGIHLESRYLASRAGKQGCWLAGLGWVFVALWLATMGLVAAMCFGVGVYEARRSLPWALAAGVPSLALLFGGLFLLRRHKRRE